jgi:hypothetical protein
MIRVIFHIGTNKTGSSAIQGFLDSNPEFLATHGLLYPRATRSGSTGHHAFAENATDYNNMYDAIVGIESEYATSKLRRGVILSSEIFHTVEPFMLSRFFKGYQPTVVAFLRPHLDYYSSWYREGIKSHNFTWDYPSFLDYAARPYSGWLDLWSKVFGQENMHVILYDRKSFPNNSSTSAFFSEVLPAADIPTQHASVEQNPSISGNLLHIKLRINAHLDLEQAHEIVYEVQELSQLDPTFTGAWKMPEEYIDKTAALFQEDQLKIFESYGINLSVPTDMQTGSISPDLSRFAEDRALLIEYSRANNLSILKYLEKYT